MKLPPHLIKILKEFRDEICLRPDAKEIDLNWYDMSIGFFLARGATTNEAISLAVVARYDCQYFDGSVDVRFPD